LPAAKKSKRADVDVSAPQEFLPAANKRKPPTAFFSTGKVGKEEEKNP